MNTVKRILISQCLLGAPVRFDGRSKPLVDPRLQQWQKEGRLIPICPEVAGGLPTPRPPAEIQPTGAIFNIKGQDVTSCFKQGAQAALQLAREQQCHCALLKANSPSCSPHRTYNGQFCNQLINREGVTATLLRQHDIALFDESELDQLEQFLKQD